MRLCCARIRNNLFWLKSFLLLDPSEKTLLGSTCQVTPWICLDDTRLHSAPSQVELVPPCLRTTVRAHTAYRSFHVQLVQGPPFSPRLWPPGRRNFSWDLKILALNKFLFSECNCIGLYAFQSRPMYKSCLTLMRLPHVNAKSIFLEKIPRLFCSWDQWNDE